MKKETLHEFDLAIYPRKLWIAISKSKFDDILDDVVGFDNSYYAITETTRNKKNR